jgi:hypothetical protein
MLLDREDQITVSIMKSPWSRVANASALMCINRMKPEIIRIRPEHRGSLQLSEGDTSKRERFQNESLLG